ncbi:MAG: hypothetical protein CMO55_21950 [Verrucomicrobiales bacterium]|nr:hypothetical protein [Verrucomicrobiales bacterium]
MKRLLLLIWALALAPSFGSEGGIIRQIQSVDGNSVIYDIPINSDTGSILSFPLSSDSAIFQLYTTVTGPNNTETLKKLDEKVVGTFLPTASVEILSEDPYFPARTRADQPYGVRLSISGLLANSPDVAEHLKTVYVERSYLKYNNGNYQPTSAGGTYSDEFSFRENGTYVDNGILQMIPGPKPTKVAGEESFTVFLHPDTGTSAELSKATVQIWPVAEVQIKGLKEGEQYNSIPSNAAVSLKDLYPSSVTYAQVYKGNHAAGIEGTPLPNTVVAYNTHIPQKALLPLADLSSLLTEDGTYTVQVLTITPFNDGAPEILSHVTFDWSTTISVNGSITDAE